METLEERRRKAFVKIKDVKLDTDKEIMDELNELNIIRTSWRDYSLMMLNSTADPLRSIWREKIVTSHCHWTYEKGSISEGNIAGMEILTVLPSKLTEYLVDDHFEEGELIKLNRLNGSKRMNVHIGHYPQESTSNEANICLKYLVKNFDNIIYEGKTGKDLLMEIPLLFRMWDISQKTAGESITSDEILTYNLDKTMNDSEYGAWMCALDDVALNGIPSEKYAEYWKLSKIEGYPLAEYDSTEKNWVGKDGKTIPLDIQKENFVKMCDVILKEDVNMCCCWKKIAICILKNDCQMKYAGFSETLRERIAREEAIAAFSQKQEEKEKAKENARILAEKIEKENKQN